jgi:predicted hydrolase (HD superfamily)
MTREEARKILAELTKTDSLLRHARSVELVMEAYATEFGEDDEEWAVTGMLHDADYEKFPEKHPSVIVSMLREMKEEKIAHAIAAHYTKWNVPYTNLLDKALLACDEITGFIIACTQVRPEKITGLQPESVLKKLKQKSFAASVDRDEVYKGAEILGVPLEDHIRFIIAVLERNKEELKLV